MDWQYATADSWNDDEVTAVDSTAEARRSTGAGQATITAYDTRDQPAKVVTVIGITAGEVDVEVGVVYNPRPDKVDVIAAWRFPDA